MRTICASSVSLPTRSARIVSVPVPAIVAPITRSPGRLSTGIDSPVTIDSSTAAPPSTTTPSTGTFSPGRTRSTSPTCTCVERHVVLAAAADEPRGLRREAEQLADRRARPVARAQLQHLAEQHEHGDDDGRVEVGVDRAVHAEAGGKQPGATVATTL